MGRIKVLISDLDSTLFEAGTQNVRDRLEGMRQ